MSTFVERFHKRYTVNSETHCWEWIGMFRNGAGLFPLIGKNVPATVFSYEVFVESISEGCEVIQSCGNRKCVNPAHLEQVPLGDPLGRFSFSL